jgi:hypothetical protein
MRKIFLILVSLLVTLFSYSQNVNKILKATSSRYNNDKWELTETQYPNNQYVILDDWNVTIGKFKIITYGNKQKSIYDDHITYTWNAITEDSADCYFMIKIFRPEITKHTVFSVYYPPPTDFYYPILQEFECE